MELIVVAIYCICRNFKFSIGVITSVPTNEIIPLNIRSSCQCDRIARMIYRIICSNNISVRYRVLLINVIQMIAYCNINRCRCLRFFRFIAVNCRAGFIQINNHIP